MSEENSEVKKSVIDPGWNDPPMLSTPNVQPAVKRNILNKRVAFPLFNGGSSGAVSGGTNINLSSAPPRQMPEGIIPSITRPPPPNPLDQQTVFNPNLPQ